MTHYAMIVDLNVCVGCNACMAACSIENQTPVWRDEYRTYVHDNEKGNTDEDVARHFLPRLCNHCDNPPCMSVCPTGATYKMDNGIVKVHPELCMGCQACVLACPYDARYGLTYSDIENAKAMHGEALKRDTPGVDKCDFCYDRLQRGEEPACVSTCVGRSRIFGDLDDPNSEVTQLVKSGMAKGMLTHLGTRPNVYYIEVVKS